MEHIPIRHGDGSRRSLCATKNAEGFSKVLPRLWYVVSRQSTRGPMYSPNHHTRGYHIIPSRITRAEELLRTTMFGYIRNVKLLNLNKIALIFPDKPYVFMPKTGGEITTAQQQHYYHHSSKPYLPVMDSSDASSRGVAPAWICAPRQVLPVVGCGPGAVVGSRLRASSAGGAPSQRPGAMLASVRVDHAKQLRLVQAHFLAGALFGAVAD